MSSLTERMRGWLQTPQGRLSKAYRETWDTPHGRLVLEDLLRFCNPMNVSFTPGDPPGSARYNEGRRRVGLRIASYLSMKERQLERLAARRIPNGEIDHENDD